MPRTLYLHIGTHRTATTSIQKLLFQNFDALLDKGWFYPFRVRRHLDLMNRVFSGEQDVDDLARTLEKRAASKEREIHSIVLSDEDVSMRRDPSVLAGLRRHFDVKVVYALRRQDLWLESWYLQNVKWQWQPRFAHCSFAEFMDRIEEFHWVDYDAYVGRLERLFGAENMRLYVYEKEQMPRGPVAAFCAAIGLDMAGLSEPPHANSSRSPQMSEFMRHLPLDLASVGVRNALVKTCETVDTEILGSTRASELLMTHGQRRAVMDRYAPGNRAVARRHFGREELFLAPLPPADAPLADRSLPSDPAVLISRFVAPLLVELMRRDAILSAREIAEREAQAASGGAGRG